MLKCAFAVSKHNDRPHSPQQTKQAHFTSRSAKERWRMYLEQLSLDIRRRAIGAPRSSLVSCYHTPTQHIHLLCCIQCQPAFHRSMRTDGIRGNKTKVVEKLTFPRQEFLLTSSLLESLLVSESLDRSASCLPLPRPRPRPGGSKRKTRSVSLVSAYGVMISFLANMKTILCRCPQWNSFKPKYQTTFYSKQDETE